MAIIKGKRIETKTVRQATRTPARTAKQIPAGDKGRRSVPATRMAVRGKRSGSDTWDTQKWLIGKKLAHVVKKKLIADFRDGGFAKLTKVRRDGASRPKQIARPEARKPQARRYK